MGKLSTAEVLRLRSGQPVRLRAIKLSVCDRSAKRFAQDDDFVGVLKKNIPNRLALMDERPVRNSIYDGCSHLNPPYTLR
jgi:hypothetical protein